MTQPANRAVYVNHAKSKEEILRFTNLLWALVIREFKGRYRRSWIGPAWSILQPLLLMIVFVFIRAILNIPSDGMPYVIFSYSALVPWTFFSNAATRSSGSVYANAAIVKKIRVRREVFPTSVVVTSLVDFLISSTLLVGMMFYYKVPVTTSLFYVPLLLVLIVIFALGVGLGVASVGSFKQDVTFAIPVLMQFWLLATPIMYPLSRVPESWRYIYSLNPMVGIIEGFRGVIVRGVAPDMELLTVSLAGIALVWVIGLPLFRYVSQYFADVM